MSEPTSRRRLRRSTAHGMIGGVAAGLARYLRVDPVLIRIGFVLTLFLGGLGIVAYLAAWLLMPDEHGRAPIGDDVRLPGGSDDLTRVVGVVLVFLASLLILGHWHWTSEILLPVVLIGAGTWLLLRPRGSTTTAAQGDAGPADSPEPAPEPRAPVPAPPNEPWEDVDEAGAVATETLVPPPPRAPARPPGPPVSRVTLALVAVAAGSFGLAAAAGVDDVRAEVVLIACLAITGLGLIVGAFLDRGRSLIPLGVVLLVALSITSSLEVPLRGGFGERSHEPTTLARVEDEYRLGVGEMVIDLTDLADDLEAGGRVVIDASIAIGDLRVIVPPDVAVVGEAHAQLGDIDAFGDDESGADAERRIDRPGRAGAGVIDLDLEVAIGAVTVR